MRNNGGTCGTSVVLHQGFGLEESCGQSGGNGKQFLVFPFRSDPEKVEFSLRVGTHMSTTMLDNHANRKSVDWGYDRRTDWSDPSTQVS